MSGVMRCGFLLLVLSCVHQVPLLGGEPAARVATLPQNVVGFLEYYKKFNPKSAVKTLFDESPMINASDKADELMNEMDACKSALGTFTGFEIMKSEDLAQSFKRNFLLLEFENGPAFAKMDCFLTKSGKWVLTALVIARDIEKVMPSCCDAGGKG